MHQFETKFEFGPWQQAWLTTLEKSKLYQCTGQLCLAEREGYRRKVNFSFCCLGVLCEVLLQNGVDLQTVDDLFSDEYYKQDMERWRETGREDIWKPEEELVAKVSYDDEDGYLPTTVQDKVRLLSPDGLFSTEYTEWLLERDRQQAEYLVSLKGLAEMNDSGKTFTDIAAIIRKHPWAIFDGPDTGE